MSGIRIRIRRRIRRILTAYQWAGKPTGEKKPRPVMPRPEMLPHDLEQVN